MTNNYKEIATGWEIEEHFARYLNEMYTITILGVDYYGEDIMRECDPIHYSEELSNYTDMLLEESILIENDSQYYWNDNTIDYSTDKDRL